MRANPVAGSTDAAHAPAGPRDFPTLMVLASVATLLLALAIQLAVYGDGGHTALSDLPRVYLHRGVGPGALPYVDRAIEYPVGAGVLLYLASLVAPSALGVLLVTAVAASALCVAMTVVLERRCGTRAWRWAIGTPLVLFAFQNWDVFAIAATVAALVAFERHRDRSAGALLAVGAAVKLFPAVVLPPLVALRWAAGDRRGAWRLALTGAAVFVALNLPFVLANRGGWWWPFAFQGRRDATWGSLWFWAFRVLELPVHGPAGARFANVVSSGALLVGLAWLTVHAVRHRLEPVAAAAGAIAVFILCNKVYSPTYDVWLVAFFVLLPIRRSLWLAFCAVDLAVCLTVYGYFHGVAGGAFVHDVLPWLVLFRTGTLVVVLAVASRTARARRGLAPTDGDRPAALALAPLVPGL